jgi:O-antigen/teichoic acid export membrane protein
VWAIAGVIAGHGVWSLATGIVVRSAVSTAALGAVVGWGILIPSLARYRVVLGAIGFGIRFSLHTLTNVLYEQTRNIIIALIGGTQALGLWVLAVRLLQIPSLMYQPIHAIAFPAFSQFIATGRNTRPLLERVTALTFAASSLVLPAFLVAAPGFIATVLGPQWEDAALVFPGILLSTFIGLPVAGVSIQFLYASGRPAAVLWVTFAAVVVNLLCIALLFWLTGLAGVGYGTVPGAALESLIFSRIVRRMNGSELLSPMPRFLVAGLLAVVGGLGVSSVIASEALAAVLGGAAALAVAGIVCVVVAKSLVRDLVGVARRSVSTALAGER